MKVGLIGFGRTGRAVAHEILKDKSLTLKWVLRKSQDCVGMYASDLLGHDHGRGKIYSIQGLNREAFFKNNFVDVIIDFSSANSIYEYHPAARFGTRIVSAISNYDRTHLLELESLSRHVAVLHSPNITLGINFLMGVSKILQEIVPEADIEIIEEHFRGKKDVSGTALRIAKALGLDEKEHVNSIRVGGIVGKHEIIFGLPNQTIRLVHESLDRGAFGQGAIFAAKWLMGKPKGFYVMEEALGLKMNDRSSLPRVKSIS